MLDDALGRPLRFVLTPPVKYLVKLPRSNQDCTWHYQISYNIFACVPELR